VSAAEWPVEITTIPRSVAAAPVAAASAAKTPEAVAPDHEVSGPIAACLSVEAEVYAALSLGVGDYVRRMGFGRW